MIRLSIILTVICVLGTGVTRCQDIYHEVRVMDTDDATLQILHEAGISLDHVHMKKGVFIDVVATDDQVLQLRKEGLPVQIRKQDLTKYFQLRSKKALERGFELGSMLGNYTLEEALAKMDSLAKHYPQWVSPKISIGQSIEGRQIWAFKVSDNPLVDEDEPEVLYTGLTHAREPLGMMNLMVFVQNLCETYSVKPVSRFLVDNREMWFIPIVNPDGYVYNETIAPNGGGMHRKNRRPVCTSGTSQGVDLNRNYSYEWGKDNSGSSPDSCSAVYRGKSAFSEPETAAIRDFVQNYEFKNVLHYHAYSNVLIHSWGNGSLPQEPDLSTIKEIGAEMTRENGYRVGTGVETIGYGVNGDAVDWSYGVEGLISYTPEVGSYQENFWPPENRVIPLSLDQIYANEVFAMVAGSDLILHSHRIDPAHPRPGDTVQVRFTIQNRGLSDSPSPLNVSLYSLTENLNPSQSEFTLTALSARSTDSIEVEWIVPPSLYNGTQIGISVELDDGFGIVRRDSIYWTVGLPFTLFADGGEDGIEAWDPSGGWNITTDAYDGNSAFTDSPVGNYGSNAHKVLKLKSPLDLSWIRFPTLEFMSKWDIETGWDFVRIQASANAVDWISVPGKYTHEGLGQGVQPTGEPGYDGKQLEWVSEALDLSRFSGEPQVYLRFVLTSDGYIEGNGFTFDNFSVQGYLEHHPGNVVQDQKLDIFDILRLIEYSISSTTLTPEQKQLADMDQDGEITLDDVQQLVKQVLGP